MKNNLLIIGAGMYGVVAKEIAESMMCFGKIDFVDDCAAQAINGDAVVGTTDQLKLLQNDYSKIIVAIGKAEIRLQLLQKIKNKTDFDVVTLVSPRAAVSPSALVCEGSVVEPMAVVHAGCKLERGCFVSAGAVVNHYSTLCECVHVDCNAIVLGNKIVPPKTKVFSGTVFE